MKTEENAEWAAQRVRLYSIPAYERPTMDRSTAAEMTRLRETSQQRLSPRARPRLRLNPPADTQSTEPRASSVTTTSSNTSRKISPRSSGLKIRFRLRAASPKRLVLRGPRRIPQINTRCRIPGSTSKMYVCGSKRYECPEGIKPWLPEHKWMLDPSQGVFKRFTSRILVGDDTHYYVPEKATADSSDVDPSQ